MLPTGKYSLKLDNYYIINSHKHYIDTFYEMLDKFQKLKHLELERMARYTLEQMMETEQRFIIICYIIQMTDYNHYILMNQ